MARLLRSSVVWLFAALLPVVPLLAQEPPQNLPAAPALKVESRIVVVDVVVSDGKRQAVAGLSAKDFRVAEDGRVQTISSFEEHKPSQAEPISLPEMPPNVFTKLPRDKASGLGERCAVRFPEYPDAGSELCAQPADSISAGCHTGYPGCDFLTWFSAANGPRLYDKLFWIVCCTG